MSKSKTIGALRHIVKDKMVLNGRCEVKDSKSQPQLIWSKYFNSDLYTNRVPNGLDFRLLT